MTLTRGKKLGRYEILAPLGKGGMGEVYRAKDTQLGRQVAIKVLPESLAQNTDEEGVAYAVMELLEGETLRTRLNNSAIPLRKALEISASIADGQRTPPGVLIMF